jgi:hypothetical protein
MNREALHPAMQWDGLPCSLPFVYLLVALFRDGTHGSRARPSEHQFQRLSGHRRSRRRRGVMDEPSLYELADLDRDRYTILAVDLTVKGRTTATVYAIDRVQHPDALSSEIAERGQNQGDVPVVPFDLPEASAEKFMRRAFSRISVRFVTRPLRDHALVITELTA